MLPCASCLCLKASFNFFHMFLTSFNFDNYLVDEKHDTLNSS